MQPSQKLQLLVWCAMKVSFYTTLSLLYTVLTVNHENVDIANRVNACADTEESRGITLPQIAKNALRLEERVVQVATDETISHKNVTVRRNR